MIMQRPAPLRSLAFPIAHCDGSLDADIDIECINPIEKHKNEDPETTQESASSATLLAALPLGYLTDLSFDVAATLVEDFKAKQPLSRVAGEWTRPLSSLAEFLPHAREGLLKSPTPGPLRIHWVASLGMLQRRAPTTNFR